jgi:hypothetical protein
MGDNRAMIGRRKKALMIVAAIVPVVLGLWLAQHVRERRKAVEREAHYQAVLAKYTGELKPGMTREQVEERLQTDGKQFRQLCCAAILRGQYGLAPWRETNS